MRQKNNHFQRQIRKNQIENYFYERRKTFQSESINHKVIQYTVEQPLSMRTKVSGKQSQQTSFIQHGILNQVDVIQKWNHLEYQLKTCIHSGDFEGIAKLIAEVYGYLKKIIKTQRNKVQPRFQQFLGKEIIVDAINCLIEATNQRKNAGLIQVISTKAVSILDLCIEVKPLHFKEGIFIKSNLLLFLAYALDEPKYDFSHLSKIANIITHMINISCSDAGDLFRLLNSRNQTFSIASIFFNICKVPLRPKDHLTQNFIILMKFYLSQIQKNTQTLNKKSLKKILRQQNSCLLKEEYQLVLQVSINSVNALSSSYLDDPEEVQCLEEALQVTRILIQYFQVRPKFYNKLQYRRLIKLLLQKECIIQIKSKILQILDHLVVIDEDKGDLTDHFVKECELIDTLWGLKDDLTGTVMNIFCNLALQSSIKIFFNRYVHQIVINLKYTSNDKLLYTFVYNWLYSQQFQIRDSLDKLIVEMLKESDQQSMEIIELQCLLWYQLCLKNHIDVPIRILEMDNESSRRIREEILLQTQQL